MSKKIYIGEDNLINIKNAMAGKNISHSTFMSEDKPPYEKDEYEIGGEGGNNDFFHVNESYGFSRNVDLSEVGRVNYTWDFDEDYYHEWLEDNEYADNEDIKLQYIKEGNVEFELDFCDNQTYHTMGSDSVYYDDLEDLFGERMAETILKNCIEDGSGYFETEELYYDDSFDINNPSELDNMAMKVLRHGEYYKDCRGFILSNGVVVYTDMEHNEVTRIPGINDKFQFIELGNIRVLDHSIDIGKEPTRQQYEVLKQVLRTYDGEELYLDIFCNNSEIGAHYPVCNPNYVLGEITRFYSEGIKPQGGTFYEEKQVVKENTFEKWFEGSVLVDEDGKPIKMYHGTSKKFDSFSKDFINSSGAGAYEGYGFNFTPHWSTAAHYSTDGNIIEAYLSVKHPLKSTENTLSLNTVMKVIAEIDKGVPVTDRIVAAFESPRYNENWDEVYYKRALRKAAQSIIEYNGEDYGNAGIYAGVCESGQGNPKKTIEAFEKLGYDSAIFYDENGKIRTVIVFEPNQIKLVNNKTFSIDSDIMSENIESKRCKKIIMPENKLIAIKEHHLDQRLPFKEPGHAYKYAIEQYRDWLEEYGRYGELPAGALDFWDEIEKAAKYIYDNRLENGNNKEKGFYNFINNYHKTPKGIVGILKRKRIGPYINVTSDNKVYVERLIYAPSSYSCDENGNFELFEPDSRSLDKNNAVYNTMMEDYGFNVGGCWSYKVGAAQGYCKNSLGKAIILRGYIRTDDIDFVKTVLLNFKYPTEHEIRVKPFAKVELFNFSFGKLFDEGFDTINFEKPLIVSSTYSGNKQKNFKGIMTVDDGFGGVSFVDVNKKPIANDEYFSKLNEYINSLDGFKQLRNNKHFVYVDTYGEIVILAAGGKVNFYHINKKCIVSDIWFDRFKLPEEKDANFREMFNTILAELENVIYAINVPDGTITKTNLTYDDISKATVGLGNKITENLENEVEANQVNLDSFKKQKELAPKIWDGDKLNSRVRLKLLDIADDFWDTTDIGWVKPKGIVLMGSICNYNWSKSSDIDLHIQVDFSEVDEKKDFVQEYFNGKKNEWNEEHSNLKIFGFPVEVYVEDIDADTNSGGIYDLEENDWIKKPSKDGIKQIGLNKYSIKDKSAKIMTDIDDLYDAFKKTDDDAKLRKIGEKARHILDYVKAMRKYGLSRGGESDKDNIVYKVLRRTGYMDTLWNLSSQLYDKLNSIDEVTEGQAGLILEYLEDKHNLPLYQYFKWAKSATDKDKAIDLLIQCGDVAIKYLETRNANQCDELRDLRIRLKREGEDAQYENDFIEAFGNGIANNGLMRDFEFFMRYRGDFYELPSWMTMDFNRIVKNEWCIHFCYDADSIAREGFKWGTDDIGKLALTGAGMEKPSEGYNFAFPIGEYHIDSNSYGSFNPSTRQRGSQEAVIFQTSGVEVYHEGDEQNQVVFWGPNAKNFIPIKYDREQGGWCIYGNKGQVLYTGKPSKILEWVLTNLPQYRKQIMVGKNGVNLKENTDLFTLAKERFGTTYDIRECGYILPDGSMLDFSGRHMITGNTDTSHLRGRRSIDHRDIIDLKWDADMSTETGINTNMEEFIRSGAIRIHCSNTWSSINLFNKPTKEQINVLLRLIQYSKGNVTVEIGDGNESYSYAEYDEAKPRKVISDIVKYFDEGINLIGNVTENKVIKEYFNKYCCLNEEVVADGNASHNPFKQRWKHERETLINYLVNYGELMTSKENGKQYKVLFDGMLSNRIGFNYCLCIQWNPLTMEPGNVIYVRAYDKFTKKIFRPQFDTRGFDNVVGTTDDVV